MTELFECDRIVSFHRFVKIILSHPRFLPRRAGRSRARASTMTPSDGVDSFSSDGGDSFSSDGDDSFSSDGGDSFSSDGGDSFSSDGGDSLRESRKKRRRRGEDSAQPS